MRSLERLSYTEVLMSDGVVFAHNRFERVMEFVLDRIHNNDELEIVEVTLWRNGFGTGMLVNDKDEYWAVKMHQPVQVIDLNQEGIE